MADPERMWISDDERAFDEMSDEQRDAVGATVVWTASNGIDADRPVDHYDTDMTDEQWSNS